MHQRAILKPEVPELDNKKCDHIHTDKWKGEEKIKIYQCEAFNHATLLIFLRQNETKQTKNSCMGNKL